MGVLLALHLVAAGILLWSEGDTIARLAFVLAWGLWNFIILLILRRPIVAAAASLLLLMVLVLLSQLKYQALFQTVSFVDVMIIDGNTIRFLFAIYPSLTQIVAVVAPVAARCWSGSGGSTRCGCRAGFRWPDARPALQASAPSALGSRWSRARRSTAATSCRTSPAPASTR